MELDLGLESIEARLGSCPGVGLSYNLKKYGQESDTQEAPGAEHTSLQRLVTSCIPHVGEVQYIQLGQLWLTSGHPGALTYGLHPTHPHSAAQTNS